MKVNEVIKEIVTIFGTATCIILVVNAVYELDIVMVLSIVLLIFIVAGIIVQIVQR